jgi:hypothetical protein
VSQARLEKLPLLTADETLSKYDVEIVHACTTRNRHRCPGAHMRELACGPSHAPLV